MRYDWFSHFKFLIAKLQGAEMVSRFLMMEESEGHCVLRPASVYDFGTCIIPTKAPRRRTPAYSHLDLQAINWLHIREATPEAFSGPILLDDWIQLSRAFLADRRVGKASRRTCRPSRGLPKT
jgi:hypothetical protein